MKIIYLHQYFKSNKSSGSTRSYEFSKALANKGNEVNIITGSQIDEYDLGENIKIYSTKTQYSNNMNFTRRIMAFIDYILKSILIGIKIKDVDVIFATSTPLTIGIPGYILSKFKKAKLIFEVRDVWPDIPIELGFIKNKLVIKLLKKLELFIYKNSDQIITLSPGMYNNLLNKGISESKLSVIPNIANIPLYDSVKEDKNLIKKNLGLENKFVCIHPGTMGFVNGLDNILDVAKKVHKIDKDIVFILVGEGKEKNKLIEKKENEKIENVFILDPMPKQDVVNLIKSSDIGIMSVINYKILEDNSANKFFDFLAAGLPIMINYKGWQGKKLNDYNCGYSCEYTNPSDMALKIIDLKNNEELFNEMKINSKKLANQKYSLEVSLEKLYEVFNKVSIKKERKMR